jgi:hypothetical protein
MQPKSNTYVGIGIDNDSNDEVDQEFPDDFYDNFNSAWDAQVTPLAQQQSEQPQSNGKYFNSLYPLLIDHTHFTQRSRCLPTLTPGLWRLRSIVNRQ